jgi:hypothetical protein
VIKREISDKNPWHSYITWQYHVFPTCQIRITIIHFLISEKGNNLVNMEVIVMLLLKMTYFINYTVSIYTVSICMLVFYEASGTGGT